MPMLACCKFLYMCMHADTVADLELRFPFHSVDQFPAPDGYTNCAKSYPSIIQSNKQISEFDIFDCCIVCCLQNSLPVQSKEVDYKMLEIWHFYFPPGRGAKYCNLHVCVMYVCLFVSPFTYIKNFMFRFQIFLLWLVIIFFSGIVTCGHGSVLLSWQCNVMYFRFL